MKRLFIGIIGASMFFASCGNSAELEKLRKANDSLVGITQNSDATIEQYIADFNEIQDNLNTIKEKEGLISGSAEGEVSEDTKTRIQTDLASIQELMADNKTKLADLQKKLKTTNNKNSELAKLIEGLEQRIQLQEQDIADLRAQLEQANIQIAGLSRTTDSLYLENAGQKETLQEQDIALNTGYYAVGSFKELKDNKVIDKGGAFAAKSGSKLSTDLNMSYLTKTDIRNLTEISFGGTKKPKLVTSHPAGSYKFDPDNKKASKLVILDQTQFWKNSKYCVVMVE